MSNDNVQLMSLCDGHEAQHNVVVASTEYIKLCAGGNNDESILLSAATRCVKIISEIIIIVIVDCRVL